MRFVARTRGLVSRIDRVSPPPGTSGTWTSRREALYDAIRCGSLHAPRARPPNACCGALRWVRSRALATSEPRGEGERGRSGHTPPGGGREPDGQGKRALRAAASDGTRRRRNDGASDVALAGVMRMWRASARALRDAAAAYRIELGRGPRLAGGHVETVQPGRGRPDGCTVHRQPAGGFGAPPAGAVRPEPSDARYCRGRLALARDGRAPPRVIRRCTGRSGDLRVAGHARTWSRDHTTTPRPRWARPDRQGYGGGRRGYARPAVLLAVRRLLFVGGREPLHRVPSGIGGDGARLSVCRGSFHVRRPGRQHTSTGRVPDSGMVLWRACRTGILTRGASNVTWAPGVLIYVRYWRRRGTVAGPPAVLLPWLFAARPLPVFRENWCGLADHRVMGAF